MRSEPAVGIGVDFSEFCQSISSFESRQHLDDLLEIVEHDNLFDDLLSDVRQAHQRLSKEKMIPAPTKGKKKTGAAAITVKARDIYTELTGKRPGRSISPADGRHTGRFHAFLKELFEVLGVDGSAGSQIDLMIRREKGKVAFTTSMEEKPSK